MNNNANPSNYGHSATYNLNPQQINKSNVKIVCRIRAPKQYERKIPHQNDNYKSLNQTLGNQSVDKSYTSLRHRTRSNSKEITNSPFRHGAKLRQASKDSMQFQNTTQSIAISHRSNSKSNSQHRGGRSNSKNKVSFTVNSNNSGLINPEKKYCIFTTKERSQMILTSEMGVPGKVINEQLIEGQDLKYFKSTIMNNEQSDQFQFDQVFNESHKQDKFYQATVSPAIKAFVEGFNTSILLFGPTEGGKTFTLKGKTGVERGILPRAVEDIFNIVRNTEQQEEEYETINLRMMQYSSDNDDYQLEDDRATFPPPKAYNSQHSVDSYPQERMFLKISVYQIFIDKVLDLLTSNKTPTSHKAQVNSFIDRETHEVVSRLANVTEKAIFTLEDFYSVLQEAFKNRRIESVNSLQDQDLRKKAHFVIGLTLMRRNSQKQLIELSRLNFVELCGSEQAVAEDMLYKSQSIRQFVTKSFNSLSSQILKAALRKKQSSSLEDSEAKLVSSIKQTLTANSNIIVICNVNPSQAAFEHSLPAIKFCSRIRECIIKKQKQNTFVGQINQSVRDNQISSSRDQNQDLDNNTSQSVDESNCYFQQDLPEYNTKNNFDQSSLQNKQTSYRTNKENINSQNKPQSIRNPQQNNEQLELQNYIQKLKDEINFRQSNLVQFERYENEKWSQNTQEKIDRLIKKLHDKQNERNRLSTSMLVQQLEFLRSTVQKVRQRDRSLSHEFIRRSSSKERENHHCGDFRDNQYESNYSRSKERNQVNDNVNQQQDDQDMRQSYGLNQRVINQLSDYKSEQINNYIYTEDYQAPSKLSQDRNVFSCQKQTNFAPVRSSLSPTQYRSIRPAPQSQAYQGKQNQPTQILQEHETIILSEKGGNLMQSDDTLSQHSKFSNNTDGFPQQIQVYKRSPKDIQNQKLNSSQDQNQTISINNIEAYEIQSNVHSENDFLNKVNPYGDKSQALVQKQNSIQIQLSPRATISTPQNTRINTQGYRSQQQNNGLLMKQSQLPVQNQIFTSDGTVISQVQQNNLNTTQNSNNTFSISKTIKNPLTNYLQSQHASVRQSFNQSVLSQPISDNISKLTLLKQETVYQNQQEALNDISRLMKLGDFDGIKLRFMQILKENQESDKIMDEQVEIMKSLRGELGQKEELLEEQDKLIREAHNQFQATIEEVNQIKLDREIEHSQQTQELAQHMKEMQSRLQILEAEKDQLQKGMDILEIENRQLIKLREESDLNFGKVKEENDKMRSNYDILKEHELNIIKDYEAKKNKEIQFYDQKVIDITKQIQEERQARQQYEEKLFQLKEEVQKLEYQLLKTQDDRSHLEQQTEQLNQKIQDKQKQLDYQSNQIQDLTLQQEQLKRDKEQTDEERREAYNEIGKLHQLVEEMDKNIQVEQQKLLEETNQRKERDQEIEQLKNNLEQLKEQIIDKDQQIEQHQAQEEEYKRQLSQLAQMHEDLEMQLTKMKAKEYDKVDVMKKGVEVESRLSYYRLDNENLVRERNNLDIANVTLKKQNQELQNQLIQLSEELDFFKHAHEQHLDKFDQKFEHISIELSKLKNENIQLKEREKVYKKKIKELEEERDEMERQVRVNERRAEELQQHVEDIEREVRVIMQEKEREAKDSLVNKLQFEQRHKEDQKTKMIGDIQGMIKSYKQERSTSKNGAYSNLNNKENIITSPRSTHNANNNNHNGNVSMGGVGVFGQGGYSTNSSGYYQ